MTVSAISQPPFMIDAESEKSTTWPDGCIVFCRDTNNFYQLVNNTFVLINDKSYASLTGKPTIPAAQVNSDWSSNSGVSQILNRPSIVAPSQSAATRAFGTTGWQISATRAATVAYAITMSTTLSLSGGSAGYVSLEIASNSTFTTNLQELSRVSNTQTGTLTVGLALNQTIGGVLSGFVPVGYYVRMKTTNTTGTPTYAYVCGQETLM